MKTPKILVAICNYNHSQYLKESIESIQNQSYGNLDICVVDDGSNDSGVVRGILDASSDDSRVRSLFQTNNGKWHALNEAIRTSEADICTSHDADDVSLMDRIEIQFKSMIHSNSIHNLCGFYHCWDENDVIKWKDNRYNPEEHIKIFDCNTVGNLVMTGFKHPSINHYFTGDFETAGVSGMFYKEIWDRGIRFNPPDLGLRVLLSEDSDFNFRITQAFNKTSVTALPLYCYRRNTSTNQELL